MTDSGLSIEIKTGIETKDEAFVVAVDALKHILAATKIGKRPCHIGAELFSGIDQGCVGCISWYALNSLVTYGFVEPFTLGREPAKPEIMGDEWILLSDGNDIVDITPPNSGRG